MLIRLPCDFMETKFMLIRHPCDFMETKFMFIGLLCYFMETKFMLIRLPCDFMETKFMLIRHPCDFMETKFMLRYKSNDIPCFNFVSKEVSSACLAFHSFCCTVSSSYGLSARNRGMETKHSLPQLYENASHVYLTYKYTFILRCIRIGDDYYRA